MSRRYEQRKRAEAVEDTRRRIVAATLALHEDVGPSRTTVAAIAERAGVSRPTVYAQYPDERSLYAACGAHFRELHPFPNLDDVPLEQALSRLYEYYRENRRVLAHVDRDARALPALAGARRPLTDYLERFATEQERTLGGRSAPIARVALEFTTWELLDTIGLSPDDAASLMAHVVRCAARS
jgi:AcrR family transcriptional regulator